MPEPFVIVCSRGQRSTPCAYCGRPSSRLCDFPVTRNGKRGTCDAALCARCTSKIAGDGDLCRAHAPLWNKATGKATVGPGATDGGGGGAA
jgi:hypothetical protein